MDLFMILIVLVVVLAPYGYGLYVSHFLPLERKEKYFKVRVESPVFFHGPCRVLYSDNGGITWNKVLSLKYTHHGMELTSYNIECEFEEEKALRKFSSLRAVEQHNTKILNRYQGITE